MAWRVAILMLFCLTVGTAEGQEPGHIDSIRLMLPGLPNGVKKAFLSKEVAWAYKSSQPAMAHEYANQSLRIAQGLKYPKGIADAKHTIGMIYWYQGDYSQASQNFFEALSIRESINDSLGLSRSYNNIGNVYFRQGDFEKAFLYYNQSLNMRRQLKDSIGILYSLSSIADVKTELEHYDAALSNYQEALGIAAAISNRSGQAFIHEKIGLLWMRQEQLQEATGQFMTALEINQRIGDDNQATRSRIQLGRALLKLDSISPAVGLLSEAISTSRQLDAKGLQSEATQLLSEAYARQGRYDSAYHYQKAYIELYTFLMNAEREQVLLSVQEQYDSEKQRADLLESKRQAARTQKFLYIALLIALSMLALFIISRFRYQIKLTRILKEKNREIEEQNISLRQSNQALEQFAFVASHDLREPLRTIGSFASLLSRRYKEMLGQNGRDYIEFIVQGTRQMSRLLDDLLAFAHLSGIKEAPRVKIALNQTLDQVLDTLQPEIKKKKAVIHRADLPTLQAIPAQMHQLFQHIISNALKFNDKEIPVIHISYQKENEGHHFSIQDNGIGIGSQYFNKIFLVFQRLEKQDYSGTGIGLAICEKIIQHHRGRIWVESAEGKGSTFHFILPED